jgi:hypothetical protein
MVFAEDKKDESKIPQSIIDAAKNSVKGIDKDAFISTMTSGPMIDASKAAHNFFESSIPGKIGFGFVM